LAFRRAGRLRRPTGRVWRALKSEWSTLVVQELHHGTINVPAGEKGTHNDIVALEVGARRCPKPWEKEAKNAPASENQWA
jgi:hypothetical protein